jgi:hypothetical protein
MEADPATDLIEQFINDSLKPDEPAKFVFPVVEDEFSDTLALLCTMARKSKIAYEVITTSDDKKRRAFQDAINGATHTHLVTDVWTQMEQILVDAKKSALFVLWDEKRDQELQELCFKFVDADVEVFDLTNGLASLGREEGEEGEGVEEDEEDAQDVKELEAEAGVYSRSQLEKMSHADVKDIAVAMGLAPRKARENMIQAILEAQGASEAVTVAPVEPQVVTAVGTAAVQTGAAAEFLEGLEGILDAFGSRFMGGLDDWLTKFSTAAEGFAFNTKPEEPMDVEPEPSSRRRLVRH